MDHDELELKKYEAKLNLIKTGIVGGSVTLITAIISGLVSVISAQQEAKKEIELQIRRSEQEHIVKFADDAISGDWKKEGDSLSIL